MSSNSSQREKTNTAVLEAEKAWDKAPLHIKAMAGAYVGPLMAAMVAINKELQQLQAAAGTVSR